MVPEIIETMVIKNELISQLKHTTLTLFRSSLRFDKESIMLFLDILGELCCRLYHKFKKSSQKRFKHSFPGVPGQYLDITYSSAVVSLMKPQLLHSRAVDIISKDPMNNTVIFYQMFDLLILLP